MNEVFLLLGGNIGDRNNYLNKAKEKIENSIGKIIKHSSIYETAAWGVTNQADFLNQVIVCKTSLNAKDCLKVSQSIEIELERIRHKKWSERTIDIDILYFNNEIIYSNELIVPHPEIPNRRFTLIPLTEINPNKIHPSLKHSQKQLLENCFDKMEVKIFTDINS